VLQGDTNVGTGTLARHKHLIGIDRLLFSAQAYIASAKGRLNLSTVHAILDSAPANKQLNSTLLTN
jgi:hypothetical protein